MCGSGLGELCVWFDSDGFYFVLVGIGGRDLAIGLDLNFRAILCGAGLCFGWGLCWVVFGVTAVACVFF